MDHQENVHAECKQSACEREAMRVYICLHILMYACTCLYMPLHAYIVGA